jgi:hypothetical protein
MINEAGLPPPFNSAEPIPAMVSTRPEPPKPPSIGPGASTVLKIWTSWPWSMRHNRPVSGG